jgi:hypothetical protein
VKARLYEFLKSLGIAVGILFWAAVVGMFVEGHFPCLHPFVTWTFRVYFGIFAAGAIGLVIVAPGMYVAKEIYEAVTDLRASKLERRLTQIWSGCTGFLLSLLLGAAAALICFGPLRDVKLWFIGVCWTLLMIPWWLAGYLGRKLVRRFSPPIGSDAGEANTEGAHGT